ncbi:homeobox and leucine zipper encoding a [Limanda limanda]|uniref:homeobox and leucine zipper encoding a n=1 Tax=Limanda limanda TaxID=27771 RepID=UPI0029C91F7F|nr:homeobox and leucine zipper encoding a [Limanda limanda]
MATYSEHNGRNGLIVSMKESFEGKVTKKDCEGKFEAKRPSKDLCHSPSAAESNASGVASFTTNHNSVVCLPLVSEGLKLVWTQSDQTRELDTIPELVQAFNLFPYPSSNEVTTLARVCALPLDKVKVWFMVQRIKYGISWSSEEIEETRRKLAVPELHDDSPETNDEAKIKSKNKISEEMVIEDKIGEEVEVPPTSVTPKKTKPKCESPDSYKPAKPTTPCFSSTLPPPQDSYFYRSPADPPASTATDVSLDLSESSSRQHRHSRYKKSKAQLAALRKSFLRENWPAEAELRRLQEETGLTRNDIRKWFSDSRYQLRVGRGSLAAAQSYSQHTAAGGKHDQQTQPLPLITQKTRQPNSVKATEATRNSGTRSTDFFQTFLTNTLEAFEEKGPEAEECDVMEELSGDGDSVKDEGQSEEQPLQLTKTCKMETEIPQEPADILKSSPHSSPSSSPPPTNKQVSNSCSTSKKSSQPAKASPSPTPVLISGTPSTTSPSPAPALTPGGRPRKTKEQLDVLKQHFLRCQWPKSDDYTELVKLTGLPRADVIQWFGDTRYAVKNGQLRWVKGVRDQFLAELAIQQSGSGLTNGSSSGTSTRVGGSRKRKSQANVPSAGTPDIQPLLAYFLSTGPLHEKDLDTLCKKSKMSYQQVRDWFASQDARETEQEQSITD